MANHEKEKAPADTGAQSEPGTKHSTSALFVKAASTYHERGWQVVPLLPPVRGDSTTGKRPVGKAWPDARLTLTEIDATWKGAVTPPNLGILTGEPSGLVVLDVDDAALFAPWAKRHPEAASTRTVARGNAPEGRCHLYFALSDGTPAPQSTKGPGWDLLSTGKQAVAPPSVHFTGGTYRWNDAAVPLVPWNSAYLDGLSGTDQGAPHDDQYAYAQAVLAAECEAVAATSEGTRNDRLNIAAVKLGGLVAAGCFGRAEVERELEAAAARCGLPANEARATIRSGLDAGIKTPHQPPPPRGKANAAPKFETNAPPEQAPEPWEAPAPLGGLSHPPPAWPWDALPSALRDMGQSIATTMNVPDELAAAAVLGVASVALGNKAKVAIKSDHRQFANLFFMVSAPVASGKTPAMRPAQAPLLEWEAQAHEIWKEKNSRYETAKRRAEAQLRGLEKKAEKSTGKDGESVGDIEREMQRIKDDLGEPPPEPVLFCEDATSEALARRIQANNGAIGVLTGEGRKVLAIAKGKYAEGGNIDLWLKGHAGDPTRVHRNNGKPSIVLEEAVIAACVMTQPDSLQSLGEIPELRDSGFLARWLFLVPENKLGEYPTACIPEDVKSRYAKAITGLIEFPLVLAHDGTDAPQVARLTSDGFKAWKVFHDTTKQEIAAQAETLPPLLQSWLGKLPEHVARLALLFRAVQHVAERKPLDNIGTAEIAAAVELASVLRAHATRAAGVIGADAGTADARRVWRWIDKRRADLADAREKDTGRRFEAVTARDLQRAEVCATGDAARDALERLVDTGHLQAVEWRKPDTKSKWRTLHYIAPR